MASPIGHMLAGCALYVLKEGPTSIRDKKALFGTCLVLAVSPDLDFLPGIFWGSPALFHQGISHSLGFAVVVSFLVAWAWQKSGRHFIGTWGLFFLAYSSHLVIDLFGVDRRPPFGIPLLWPVSDVHVLTPIPIFWGIRHAASIEVTTLEWLVGIFSTYNFWAIAIEVFILFPFVLLASFFYAHGLVNLSK